MTFETFDQSDEKTWHDQQKEDNKKDKDKDKDKYIWRAPSTFRDRPQMTIPEQLWNCWHFWQMRTSKEWHWAAFAILEYWKGENGANEQQKPIPWLVAHWRVSFHDEDDHDYHNRIVMIIWRWLKFMIIMFFCTMMMMIIMIQQERTTPARRSGGRRGVHGRPQQLLRRWWGSSSWYSIRMGWWWPGFCILW